MPQVHSVQIGKVAPLGRLGAPSGFVKRPVSGRTSVRVLGLDGDQQADLRVHGGIEKAVYGYSFDHYRSWETDFPEHSSKLVAGAFGENLTIRNLVEADICVGDVHRIGTTVLQISQPRQPCLKLALNFDDNRIPSAMVRSGRSGWYYRVLVEGEVGKGDTIELIDRPHPHFAFARLVEFVNRGTATRADLVALRRMDELAASVRRRALDRLAEL